MKDENNLSLDQTTNVLDFVAKQIDGLYRAVHNISTSVHVKDRMSLLLNKQIIDFMTEYEYISNDLDLLLTNINFANIDGINNLLADVVLLTKSASKVLSIVRDMTL